MCCLAALLVSSARAATFTVINNGDSGAGSLRQAIVDANGSAGADQISFNIPGPGVHTITVLSALPAINEAVTIDGYTQPGAAANTLAAGTNATLLIELDGNSRSFNGLAVNAPSTIRGLAIGRFSLAIVVHGAGSQVSGNYIGVDAGGTLGRGNHFGVLVGGTGGDTDNLIGGGSPAQRNVISGNDTRAIRTSGIRTTIQGNYIGTNAAGTAALANLDYAAVEIAASNCLVGGSNASPSGSCTGECNLISGNAGIGLLVDAFFAVSGNDVFGNYIGTDVSGQTAIPNGHGIGIGNTVSNRIGMDADVPAGRNVVSGNYGFGIYFFRTRTNPTTTLNSVRHNFVGLSSSGGSLGNGGHGIDMTDAFANVIAENSIAHNGDAAVAINWGLTPPTPGDDSGRNRNRISRNAIFDNKRSPATETRAETATRVGTALGIDLGLSPASGPTGGVTANDSGDGDHGPNELQNFPVIAAATSAGGATQVQGTLNSTANATFTIELFANTACDTSGFGEGETFLGDTPVTTDNAGNASFNVSLPATAVGTLITANATNAGGSTSEFSACVAVQ